MSYIGNSPITAAFLTDTFSGNGSTTAFTMTVAPANTSSVIVAITGVLQDPSTYSVSGTTLTFSAAPPTGTSNISVRYLGIPASGVTTTAYRTVTDNTATAGQTSFTVPSYTVGYINVYRNGVLLSTSDYTATTGTTVVLNNGCTVGDTITTESFYVSSVLNAIPATNASITSSYLASGVALANIGSGGVTQTYIASGAVDSGQLATAVQPLGVGQTWQDVSASRVAGTTYTNTTGRPIFVSILSQVNTNTTIVVNGVNVSAANPGASNRSGMSAIVPSGGTYSTASYQAGNWAELR